MDFVVLTFPRQQERVAVSGTAGHIWAWAWLRVKKNTEHNCKTKDLIQRSLCRTQF